MKRHDERHGRDTVIAGRKQPRDLVVRQNDGPLRLGDRAPATRAGHGHVTPAANAAPGTVSPDARDATSWAATTSGR